MPKPPFVSGPREIAINVFGAALWALCKKHSIDLVASPDGDTIEIIDRRRSGPMPEGYEFDAFFVGVDLRGIYYMPKGIRKAGIRIEKWVPEEDDAS